jgi:hypothetical protein
MWIWNGYRRLRLNGHATIITYTHDLWNRLVKVAYDSVVRAEYVYNGLHWRIIKRSDILTPGSPPTFVPDGTLDQERHMYYTANWQLLQEVIDDDIDASSPDGPDRVIQYAWGPRYIDDIILHREDPNYDDQQEYYEKVWYHCTDALFSALAILDETAMVWEAVAYDAYGTPERYERSPDRHAGRALPAEAADQGRRGDRDNSSNRCSEPPYHGFVPNRNSIRA